EPTWNKFISIRRAFLDRASCSGCLLDWSMAIELCLFRLSRNTVRNPSKRVRSRQYNRSRIFNKKKISSVIKIRRKYKRQGGLVIKKLGKMMKAFDVIIIFVVVALSFSPMASFAVQNSQNEGNKIYAVISIDGEEVDRFLLTGNEEHKLIT